MTSQGSHNFANVVNHTGLSQDKSQHSAKVYSNSPESTRNKTKSLATNTYKIIGHLGSGKLLLHLSLHVVVQVHPGVLGEGGDGLAQLLQVSPAPIAYSSSLLFQSN